MLKEIRLKYDNYLDERNKSRFDWLMGKESTFKEYREYVYDVGMRVLEDEWREHQNIKLRKRAMPWLDIKLLLVMVTLMISLSALGSRCSIVAGLGIIIAIISLGSTIILRGAVR